VGDDCIATGFTPDDDEAVTARLTAAAHIRLLVVIVHVPTLDMQAHQVVEGPGDAQPLSAGLPVGVGEEVVIKRLGELFYIA
jgi:hypothetical protein